jgi:hypothetical protein
MEQRVFGFCPFAGIMCLACEKAIGANGKSSIMSNMGKHCSKAGHSSKCSQPATKADRTAFVALAKRKLLPLARAVTVNDDVDKVRCLLAPFLTKSSTFWFCALCNSYFGIKKNHKYEHRATMVKTLAHFPTHVTGCTLIIPADYDPFMDPLVDPPRRDIYSKFFRDLLDEARSELQGRSISETERNIYSSVARRSVPVESVPQAKRRKKETKVKPGPDPIQFHLPRTPLVPEFKLPQGVLEAIFKFDSLAGGKY